jgi:hypothetical protein
MSQKRLLGLFLTLFLAVLLAIIACSADTGVYGMKLDPEAVPKELDLNDGDISTSVMNDELANVAVSKLTIKNSGGLPVVVVTTDAPLTVPAGKELVLGANVELVVDTQTAAINGRLRVEDGASLNFSGIPGDIPVDSASPVTLSGTITVESGGTFRGPPSDSSDPTKPPPFHYKGSGKVVLEYGSTAYLQVSESDILKIGPAGAIADHPIFEWGESSGSVELTQGLIMLMSGNIKVKGLDPGSGLVPIQKVLIETDANLTIADTPVTTLQIHGSLVVNGTLTADGGLIGVDNGAMITFGSNALLSGTGIGSSANFYQIGGIIPEAAMAGKTYRWDSSLNSNNGGWKVEALVD